VEPYFGAQKMWEMLANLLEFLRNNLVIWIPALWIGLAIYVVWYLYSAKQYAPMTHKEAEILWKTHKRKAQCGANEWQSIQRGKKIIGFSCACGYKHIQKRPMVIYS